MPRLLLSRYTTILRELRAHVLIAFARADAGLDHHARGDALANGLTGLPR
jgi:hypothetical protein